MSISRKSRALLAVDLADDDDSAQAICTTNGPPVIADKPVVEDNDHEGCTVVVNDAVNANNDAIVVAFLVFLGLGVVFLVVTS